MKQDDFLIGCYTESDTVTVFALELQTELKDKLRLERENIILQNKLEKALDKIQRTSNKLDEVLFSSFNRPIVSLKV